MKIKKKLNLKTPPGYKKFGVLYEYNDKDGNPAEAWIKLNCKKRPSYKEAKQFAQRKISINIDPDFAARKITRVIGLFVILV